MGRAYPSGLVDLGGNSCEYGEDVSETTPLQMQPDILEFAFLSARLQNSNSGHLSIMMTFNVFSAEVFGIINDAEQDAMQQCSSLATSTCHRPLLHPTVHLLCSFNAGKTSQTPLYQQRS